MLNNTDIQEANILIVDDQEANVLLLEQILSQAGYQNITSTRDPHAVYSLHSEHHYDLILLDLQMPGLNGFQVIEGLKTLEIDSYVPVLVITAQPAHKLRALEAGARDFISKPINLPEILMRVRNMLEVRLLYKKIESSNKELEKKVQERTSELRQAKDQLQTENIYLHKDIDFQEQLMSDLSHQLRTPLTSMRGAVELALQKSRSVESYKAALESSLSGIDRITTLVNTMLSLAKLDGHLERLQYSPSNLVELMEEIIGELTPLWEEKTIHFIFSFSQNRRFEEFPLNMAAQSFFPPYSYDLFRIEIDVFRLRQAIINILDNAYKYTPVAGQIKIEMCREMKEEKEVCRLTIMNNGPSIPDEILPDLFTRFFHGKVPHNNEEESPEGKPNNVPQGFGLGLSICRRIVEMHQGSIRAFNPPSGGAAFEIILPILETKEVHP